MTKSKHDWNSLENYLAIHERVLRNVASRMVAEKTYSLNWVTDQYLELRAENILLRTFKENVVRVDIRKDVQVDPTNPKRPRAKTYDYTYSVNIPGGDYVFRYCSPHLDVSKNAPDHHKFHHKHTFNNGKETVTRIDEANRPQVDKFLREVLETC